MFRWTYCFIATAAVLFAVSSAAAQKPNSPETWTRIDAPNFELIGNASEEDIRQTAQRLERFRGAILSVLSAKAATSKTRVVVFKDAASFRPFKPKRIDGTPDDLVSGLFQPGEDLNYIVLSGSGSELGVIYHEYTHDVLNSIFGKDEIPPWLNEGLAEYFQTFRIIDDSTAAFGGAQPARLRALTQDRLIAWNDLFSIDNVTLQQSDDGTRSRFYAQSMAAVQYLLDRTDTTNAAGRANIEPGAMLRSAADADRTEMTAGVRALIASGSFPTRSVALAGTGTELAVKGSDLSEGLTNAYLGDLLYHLKEYQGSETYLLKALTLEPKLSAANASLGMVRMRQRRFAEAQKFLEAAIRGDSNNYLVHFYYAYLLTRASMDEAGTVTRFSTETAVKIRESLRRSIDLNGKYAEAYRLAAFTALVTGEGLDDAADGLRKAIALRPGDKDLALMEAQIALRQERVDEARASAMRLLASSNDRRIKAEAEMILKSSDELKAARTKIRDDALVIEASGTRKPLILKYRDLTEEQIEAIDQERAINNTNLLIERSVDGEIQAVGRFGKIECKGDRILYRFQTGSGDLRLFGKQFDDLRIKILIEGTRAFAFKCDSAVSDELAVIVYRPSLQRSSAADGELIAINFVPGNFKLRSLKEVANTPIVIIEGRPPTITDNNEKLAAAERAEMEREMRETQLRDLEDRLRKPMEGEHRILAIPEGPICSAGKMRITARNSEGIFELQARITNGFEAHSFNSETGVLEIGCRSPLPSLPAVITFRRNPQNENDRELIAIEFVPKFYRFKESTAPLR